METLFLNKYANAYQSMTEKIAARRSRGILTSMGFTSNLDLLCDFDVARLNLLLSKYLPSGDLSKFHSASCITTMEELLQTIVYFCANGIGGEVDIADTNAVRELFHFKNGMGGTATQAALALSEVNGESLVHLTDDSKEVCDLLDTPNVYVILEDGSIGHTYQLKHCNEQELHFIVQFQKGDVIRLGDKEVIIPVSNRLILTKNTVNITVPMWKPYFKWVEENAERISSNVLSSFNCILDPDILRERIDYVAGHVARYHAANPDGIVYYEDAHYHNSIVRKMVLENLYSVVDIVGMNEEELRYTLHQMYHLQINTDDILECIEGVNFLLKKFRIHKGIVVHTKDYAMYVGEPLKADIESGLMYGNILATAKAANGWYGTPDQVKDVLKLPVSQKGMDNREIVAQSKYRDKTIVVPSRYIDKPKFTIGLGDSFVGGMQMCF
jgi:ADP-dependent phosphofructokinase/glucokinase